MYVGWELDGHPQCMNTHIYIYVYVCMLGVGMTSPRIASSMPNPLFGRENFPNPVIDGANLIAYMVRDMNEPDHEAITAAKNTSSVWVPEEQKYFGKRPFADGPWLFAHGTSVESGFSILQNGALIASDEGKVGAGVYGFFVGCKATLDQVNVLNLYKRAAVGGYNRGCLIVFAADGIIIKRCKWNTKVPAGAVATDGLEQFCAGEASYIYIYIHIYIYVHIYIYTYVCI